MSGVQKTNVTNPPLVSVILTVYKRTGYLGEALDSVLAQSYSNFEVIVADDSGMATAREIVESRAQIDQRVRYQPNPETLGIATSLVKAVKSAQGQLIAILNDDDLWEKELLSELMTPFEVNPDLVACCSDHWLMDEHGGIQRHESEAYSVKFGRASLPEGIVASAVEFAVLKHGISINICTVFQKNAIDWSLVVPEVTGAYDYWISCLLAATGRPIYYVCKRLARWRQHLEMETMRRSPDKNENLIYILNALLERGLFPDIEEPIKDELAYQFFIVGCDKLYFKKSREARFCFFKSFHLARTLRSLFYLLLTFFPAPVRIWLISPANRANI